MLSYNLFKMHSAGQDLYMPIPYQKSCKVVADEGLGNVLPLRLRFIPEGHDCADLQRRLGCGKRRRVEEGRTISSATIWATIPAGRRQGQETTSSGYARTGTTARVAELSGPQAITGIKVKRMKFADRDDQMAALRKLALRITWDGQAKPAVWVPLGDFFGTAPGENLYKTLMTGMTKDGYYANWYMPFGKSAVVELINEDKVAADRRVRDRQRPAGTAVRRPGPFPCQVAPRHFPLPKDRWPDWVMLRTQGRGPLLRSDAARVEPARRLVG